MPRTYSSVPITAGSGTPVDTVQTSADSDHRQVVVLGDPDTDTEIAGIASGRLAVAEADGANITQGAIADAAWSGSGNGTLVAVLKAIWTRLRGGQATMANSLPVALASDQGALTVSGTVTANAGSGTLAVSAASLPLPAGSSTSAKQPALGTAGTASTDVLSVQGIASMTALKVDASATTQPVSGTVTANAGSGTLAVSAAGLPLPTGAATSAKQPALGSAGAASADVLTVQGVASMTALKVDGSGVTQPVSGTVTAALGASENHLGEIGGKTILATASFTRPANTTAYVSGQLVANSTTAGSVTPMSFTAARIAAGSGMVRRARVRKSGTSLTNAAFRVHLYKTTSPTPSNGDGAAWLTDQVANYVGSLDVTMDKAFTDGANGHGQPTIGSEVNFVLTSGQLLYGLLEARGAYTPVSAETIAVDLEVLAN